MLKRVERAIDQAATGALLNATSTTPRLVEAAMQSLSALRAQAEALAARPHMHGRAAGLPQHLIDMALAECRALLLETHSAVPELEEGFATVRAAVTAMHVVSRRLASPHPAPAAADAERNPDLASLQQKALPLIKNGAEATVQGVLRRVGAGERLETVAERVRVLVEWMAAGGHSVGIEGAHPRQSGTASCPTIYILSLTDSIPPSVAGPVAQIEVPLRTQAPAADNPGDVGACSSGQLPDGSVLVAALSDAATLRLVTLPADSAGAGASSSAAQAAEGASLLAVHAYRDGLIALLSQPGGGAGGRELAFYRATDLSAGVSVALADVESADTIQLSGRQDADCVAFGEQRQLGAVFGRKRMALFDLAALG